MKLRITKGRIACAVVLLPVLYVLNTGPLAYCTIKLGLSPQVFNFVYIPLRKIVVNTPVYRPLERYIKWWVDLP